MTGPNKEGITIIFLYIHKVIIRGRLRKKLQRQGARLLRNEASGRGLVPEAQRDRNEPPPRNTPQ